VKATKNPYKCLLCCILGIGSMAQHPVAESEHAPLELLNNRRCGCSFSCQGLLDQLLNSHCSHIFLTC